MIMLLGTVLCPPIQNSTEVDVPDGFVLVQGDIIRRKSSVLRNANIQATKWHNGVIPYVFDVNSTFTQKEMDLVISSMSKISKATDDCIRFIPRTTEPAYIIIATRFSGCWSYVGRLNEPQLLSIQRYGCMYEGTIIHELLHAIGFEHEQSRPDRDSYVNVLTENIKKTYEYNFEKYNTSIVSTMSFPYDYYSIMHYGWNYFSKNGEPTILPLNSSIDYKKLGQRATMTDIDIQKILKYYKFEPKQNRTTTQITKITTNPTTSQNRNTFKILIRSAATNKYIVAGNNGKSPLIANRDDYNLTEAFELIHNTDQTVSIIAMINQKIVSVGNNGNDPLIAFRNAIGKWDKFYMQTNSDQTYSFKALVNGKYVTIESNSLLKASATKIDSKEKFYVYGF